MLLHDGFQLVVQRFPERTAVEAAGGRTITYGELDRLADRLARHLLSLGLEPGDRVGFCLWKSIDAVAAILGILKAGGVYVPLDPAAPARRNAGILDDCKVSAAVIGASFGDQIAAELDDLGWRPPVLILDQEKDGPLGSALEAVGGGDLGDAGEVPDVDTDDLAYILYTSGSTGRPKGVMVSHRNALGFVDWCDELFEPMPEDRFSSHAPLHFDLSVLDVHLSLRSGATLALVEEDLGKDPARLAEFIAETRITVWYSAPSILALMVRRGLLEQLDVSPLRLVLFAGEVFPISHLRELQRQLANREGKGPRLFNLYGPTETNVCTYHEVVERIPDEQVEDLPIGGVCPHYTARVVDPDGEDIPPGQVGELWMAGISVMKGYWNMPRETASSFADDGEHRWYRTGDLVIDTQSDQGFLFRGRRDRMIKKRGYRVELGEIESCLNAHEGVNEVGVVARPDEDRGALVTAFVGAAGETRPGIIALKAFCAQTLPLYMVPDRFMFLDELPRTSTGKVDYQNLGERLEP